MNFHHNKDKNFYQWIYLLLFILNRAQSSASKEMYEWPSVPHTVHEKEMYAKRNFEEWTKKMRVKYYLLNKLINVVIFVANKPGDATAIYFNFSGQMSSKSLHRPKWVKNRSAYRFETNAKYSNEEIKWCKIKKKSQSKEVEWRGKLF